MVARIEYNEIGNTGDIEERGYTFDIEEENEIIHREEIETEWNDFNQPLGRELTMFLNCLCAAISLSILSMVLYMMIQSI